MYSFACVVGGAPFRLTNSAGRVPRSKASTCVVRCTRAALLAVSALTTICLIASLPAGAQVQNGSFENPAVAPGVFTVGTGIPDWTDSGAIETGVWFPTPGVYFSTPVPDGNQIGYTNGLSVAQGLADVLQPGTYDLTGWIGQRLDGFVGTVSFELWVGGVVSGGSVTGGTLLSAQVLAPNVQQVSGQFVPASASFTALAGDPHLGQHLAVRIADLAGSQIDFDKVALSFQSSGVVPESGSLSLLAGGLLVPGAAFLYRRRKTCH